MAFIAIMAEKPAILLQHDDVYDEEGWRIIIKIWKVSVTRTSPDGIDYSLSMISPEGERVVGYDNHWPKGHHRHVLAEEGPYTYSGIDALVADFKADVLLARRRRS